MVPPDVEAVKAADRNESQFSPGTWGLWSPIRPQFVDEAQRPVVDSATFAPGTDRRGRGHDFRFDAEQAGCPHRDPGPSTHDPGRSVCGGFIHQEVTCRKDPTVLLQNVSNSPNRKTSFLRPIEVLPWSPKEHITSPIANEKER
jgi:hypothetical protein